MKIYHLQQVSWNDNLMSDFDLPRQLGHFRTREVAEEIRDIHIKTLNSRGHDEWVGETDYMIDEIEVMG